MLTKELIFSKNSKKLDLSEITKLNIYGEDLEDISILSSMPKLEYLSLSCNNTVYICAKFIYVIIIYLPLKN